MEWYWAVLLLLGPVMALGVPVAWTFIATNIIGTLVLGGSFASLIQVVDNSTSLLTRFTLAPVPLSSHSRRACGGRRRIRSTVASRPSAWRVIQYDGDSRAWRPALPLAARPMAPRS